MSATFSARVPSDSEIIRLTNAAERRLSVHTQGVVEILTRKGFSVTWRVNKNDDLRFRVNGTPKRGMTAYEMSEKYWSYL